ncbi:MAG: PfkB family carbohydrate kinase [Candidatus Sulfotelmatobacter sp.]
MNILQIDNRSPYRSLMGIGGLGTGLFFALEGDHTLGRNESRPARLLDVRDYCKLHIVIHYVATLLGAQPTGFPFQVLPVGKVGADQAGRHVLDEMQAVGINTALVQVVKEEPTLLSVCFQYPDGCGGNITTSNSAAAALCDRDLCEAADFLKVHGRSTIALSVPEVPLTVRREFLKLAGDAGAFRAASFVDAEIATARELGMFEMLDLLALNESEAEALTGCHFSSAASGEFLKNCQSLTDGASCNRRIVVSAGKQGAFAFAEGRYNFCPAPAVPVVSTAGAGDALLGGVLSAMAAGVPFLRSGPVRRSLSDGPLTSALELGVLLASYKVTSAHTIHPLASLDSLLKFGEDQGIEFSTDITQRVVEASRCILAPLP